MKSKTLFCLKDDPNKMYLTVGKLKEIVNKLDNDDGLVIISNGEDYFIVDNLERDEENDLLVRAETIF